MHAFPVSVIFVEALGISQTPALNKSKQDKGKSKAETE
jgi:hypothetical protein